MSMYSWTSQFYPISAKTEAATASDVTALDHSLIKWYGLRAEALSAHGLVRSHNTIGEGQSSQEGERVFFNVSGGSCALCRRYEEDCGRCVLDGCGLEWSAYMTKHDPEPMIALLEAKKAELVGGDPDPMIELLESKLAETVMNEDAGIL